MRPQELRIGNYVTIHDEEGDSIVEIIVNTLKGIEHDESWASPIPLTEEWLERFGFIKPEDSWYWSLDYDPYKETFKIAYNDVPGCWFVVGFESLLVDYVHTLQNLIYSLTGEELKIKGDEKA
jgi:hypothetical protein